MKIIKKIFRLSDLDEDQQRLKEAEEENERLQDYIVERHKQLSEVDLNNTIDMIKDLEKFIKGHQN